jgi:hypothetical protein
MTDTIINTNHNGKKKILIILVLLQFAEFILYLNYSHCKNYVGDLFFPISTFMFFIIMFIALMKYYKKYKLFIYFSSLINVIVLLYGIIYLWNNKSECFVGGDYTEVASFYTGFLGLILLFQIFKFIAIKRVRS